MQKYILIFRHQDGNKIASPEQVAIWMSQTKDWISTITVQGKFIEGQGVLFDEARVVGHGGKVQAGPFGNSTETIGGFIIVKATSVEQAVEFASGCPILQGEGNTVEVRKLASGQGN
jgi:hypothetical protein